MGEEKWTRREPGSVSGSMVPPPASRDETTPGQSPVPKPAGRTPEQQAGPARTDAAEVRRASGEAPPDRPVTVGSGSPELPRRTAYGSPRRLYVAVPQPDPAAASASITPQLPDNVRYLFKPVLTQTTLAVDFDEIDDPEPRRAAIPAAQRFGSAPSPKQAAQENADPEGGAEHDQPAAGERTRRASVLAAAGNHRRTDPLDPDGTVPAGLVASHRLRRLLSVAVGLAVVVATAAVTTLALLGGRPAGDARQTTAQGPGGAAQATPYATGAKAITGLSRAGIVRARAARWVMREVSRSVIVACDAVMCSQLFNAGIPASNLLVLSPNAADPLGADIVIGTPAVRSQFGSRLALEYAPSVLASFGAGKLRVDVRVVAPKGAGSYELALNRDIATRQRDGSQPICMAGT